MQPQVDERDPARPGGESDRELAPVGAEAHHFPEPCVAGTEQLRKLEGCVESAVAPELEHDLAPGRLEHEKADGDLTIGGRVEGSNLNGGFGIGIEARTQGSPVEECLAAA